MFGEGVGEGVEWGVDDCLWYEGGLGSRLR